MINISVKKNPDYKDPRYSNEIGEVDYYGYALPSTDTNKGNDIIQLHSVDQVIDDLSSLYVSEGGEMFVLISGTIPMHVVKFTDLCMGGL